MRCILSRKKHSFELHIVECDLHKPIINSVQLPFLLRYFLAAYLRFHLFVQVFNPKKPTTRSYTI